MAMAQVLRLKPAFTDAQAEALAGLFDDEVATKADLERLRLALGADIERFRLELRADMRTGDEALKAELQKTKVELQADVEKLRLEVQRDLKGAGARLVTWVVGQGAATIGILFALLHFTGK